MSNGTLTTDPQGGSANGISAVQPTGSSDGSDPMQGFIAPFYPAILGVIFIFICIFLGSFLSYRYRVRRGLPPLFFQRCFVRRHPSPFHQSSIWPHAGPSHGSGGYNPHWPQQPHQNQAARQRSYRNGAGAQTQNGYDLENLPPPPPAYDPSSAPPPKYPERMATAPAEDNSPPSGDKGVTGGPSNLDVMTADEPRPLQETAAAASHSRAV